MPKVRLRHGEASACYCMDGHVLTFSAVCSAAACGYSSGGIQAYINPLEGGWDDVRPSVPVDFMYKVMVQPRIVCTLKKGHKKLGFGCLRLVS